MAGLSPDVAAIHLGRMSPPASCNPPGRLIRKPIAGPCEPARRPYSVLLPVGFTVPSPLLQTRWALTPPFHPYLVIPVVAFRSKRLNNDTEDEAVYFLWHYPWGRPRRVLPGTVFPWSPDFPHLPPFGI